MSGIFKKAFFLTCISATLLGAVCAFAQTEPAKKKKAQPEQQETPHLPQLPPELMPPHPAAKMSERYFNIDAKRTLDNIMAEDALPHSREFKRIDSTYYVGWLFEGVYKYNHAEDYLGFKNAIVPLERTLNLIEHDYSKALATRTDQPIVYYPIRMIRIDYQMAVNFLMQCYANTDQPMKVYELMRRVQRWKFQMNYFDNAYNTLGWTVHRNRVYTSAKYPFLKNSIAANEKLANSYLDSALAMISRNSALNKPLGRVFPEFRNIDEEEKVGVYHYKNILYSYSLNIDSAAYYFGLMRDAGRLPHNNYANFMGICGDFRTADAEYKLASVQDSRDKRLQEWAYYSSIIDIFRSKPKNGVELARNMIKYAGTTPGYGWYNIALARCMLYDGQISEAERYVDKAADFKELHIGTTLGQTQYDFSVQLIKLINNEQSWEMDKFEHSNWWYNPAVLLDMAQKLSQKYLQQFLIINQFAQNPEREQVIYKLFSTESTVSWDEIYYLVHDFSTNFFISKFQQEAKTDTRKNIRKYFELFNARMQLQQGKVAEAKPILDKLLRDPNTDAEYEKLFTARLYQAEAECAKAQKNIAAQNDWLYKLYVLYPQLVPYTGMPANMNLYISGNVDKDVEKRLRACNINWVTNSSIPSASVYVTFTGTGDKKNISYYVLDKAGNYIVEKQGFTWKKPEEAATTLAYRIFNIGGKEPGDDEKK